MRSELILQAARDTGAQGIIPGYGGTQRLARMIGAKGALDMLLGGGMFAASRAPARGLLDAVADSEDYCRRMAGPETGRAIRRTYSPDR